jgi:hypothetical protein
MLLWPTRLLPGRKLVCLVSHCKFWSGKRLRPSLAMNCCSGSHGLDVELAYGFPLRGTNTAGKPTYTFEVLHMFCHGFLLNECWRFPISLGPMLALRHT